MVGRWEVVGRAGGRRLGGGRVGDGRWEVGIRRIAVGNDSLMAC